MTAAWSSELLWFFDSINAVPTSDFAESTCMNIAMIIEFDYVRTDMTGGSYIGQVLAESWSQAEGNASVVYTFQEGARNEVKIEAFSRSFVLESTLSSTDMLSIYSGIQATTQAVFSKSRTTDPSYQHLPGLHYLVVRGMNQYDLGEGGLNQSIFYSGSSIFEAPDFRFVSTLDGQRTLASMIRSLSSGQDAIAICTPFIPLMTDDLLAVLTEMGSDVSISQAPTAWCFFGVWGQPWHMRESFGETTMPSDYCISADAVYEYPSHAFLDVNFADYVFALSASTETMHFIVQPTDDCLDTSLCPGSCLNLDPGYLCLPHIVNLETSLPKTNEYASTLSQFSFEQVTGLLEFEAIYDSCFQLTLNEFGDSSQFYSYVDASTSSTIWRRTAQTRTTSSEPLFSPMFGAINATFSRISNSTVAFNFTTSPGFGENLTVFVNWKLQPDCFAFLSPLAAPTDAVSSSPFTLAYPLQN